MGVGAITVTLVAAMQPTFSRRSWAGRGEWLGISLLLGFGIYQSSILFVNQWVGMHGLTADVLLRIFVRDLIWAIALFGFYTVVLSHPRILRRLTR